MDKVVKICSSYLHVALPQAGVSSAKMANQDPQSSDLDYLCVGSLLLQSGWLLVELL